MMNSIRFALSGTVFISLSFLKDNFSGKSPLAGRLFSPSTLSVSMEEARLLLVDGEPMRRWSFSREAAVAASCGWFKSELSSPGQIFPWFLLSWYMCLMSLKIPLKLSVAFFCEFFFIYFWLPWVFAAAVRGLLSVVASLDAERGLWGAGLSSRGARFSCPTACGISPDQDWNACPLYWQVDS